MALKGANPSTSQIGLTRLSIVICALGSYRFNAIRQHSLDLQALAAHIGKANDRVVTE